jgi:hypothetical protein
MTQSHDGLRPTSLQVGQPFNPFRFFTGIFIPEALVRSALLSAGAKVAYGRLARYAGHNGQCFPAVGTLAEEIGVGARQAQKYLGELEKVKLIRRRARFLDGAQSSNAIEFLWHRLFQDGVNDQTGEGVNDCSLPPVNDSSPKESQIEESHFKATTTDLDYPDTNRKKRDSRLDGASPMLTCREYPGLREALARYMMAEPGDEKVYPTERHVVDVMDAAAGATEGEVLRCLSYLRDERGLKPGTRTGPHQFSWFPTVVADYFQRQRAREQFAAPASAPDSKLRPEQFDSMTAAIEI